MSLTSTASALLKQTPLQMLLEDINFQRTKEMRQLLKDDSGFVVLQGTTYWTDLFVRHFLFQPEHKQCIDSDDLLFFVRKRHVKSSSRHVPKYETEVEVFRKDSRKLPIGDPDVDWEETVYLNMVIHQFDYTLTLAICTRTSPKELQVLRRHSQRVYASPSRRKMDTKGEGEEITYPHICFMVDNFDEVFSDILVRDGEMVCVELVANDKDGSVQGVIFLGSIRYDALKKVYDARQSSLSTKVAQRMSFGLFSSGASVQTRCEFVRMKGPQGKGHAEMAVTKPKGSGVETPTSEPGFCATDMWDEWEDENEDYCTYRHQRRLSDPSANLNHFCRYGWRTKNIQEVANTRVGPKARSENEGLDSFASEVSEIEAGDLRDDPCPAFSASIAKLRLNVNVVEANDKVTEIGDDFEHIVLQTVDQPTGESGEFEDEVEIRQAKSGCSNCFGGKKCKRWTSSSLDTPQMSEIYCPPREDAANETPACLSEMPNKASKLHTRALVKVDGELMLEERSSLLRKTSIVRSSSLHSTDRKTSHKLGCLVNNIKPRKTNDRESKKSEPKESTKKQSKSTASTLLSKVAPRRLRSRSKVENSCATNDSKARKTGAIPDTSKVMPTISDETGPEECEIANEATLMSGFSDSAVLNKKSVLCESQSKSMINVRGKEELPSIGEHSTHASIEPKRISGLARFDKCIRVPVKSESHPLQPTESNTVTVCEMFDEKKLQQNDHEPHEHTPMLGDCNGNHNLQLKPVYGACDSFGNATLPRTVKHRSTNRQSVLHRAQNLVPKRRTPDGTDIYYWCDLPKQVFKELDDGAYNPLWASRGFTQSFHFWKENRRQQSTPLNAFLTYVTLPWWSIAKDLLDHRENPILTF